jgi:multidrug transporter EmrE-like cation transporter
MKLLLAVLPTILLAAYSQLVSKWRVAALAASGAAAPDPSARVLQYLTDPYIISSYVFSLLSSIAWLYALEKYPVSTAFPAYIGILFCVVTVGGVVLLREQVSAQQLAGVALILVGVGLVSRGV